MTTQSEQSLEQNLVIQLTKMQYELVAITNENDLTINLKSQLEKHNKTVFSDAEFQKVLNHLTRGNVFDRAITLRDKMHLTRDDGTSFYVEFFNPKAWCQNEFQVTQQVAIEGQYKNRYDVTILINGLPLLQIELKRRGLELKEAFNQVNRYRRHSYATGYGLYQYVQLFVISNGANTKYYSNTIGYDNDKKASYQFTSFWTDKDNNKITELSVFTESFLDRCHIAKMIAHYTVLKTDKTMVALRPYQYYAVEAIVDRVRNSAKGGYIWHTTGSGKTLTSFKASQIIVDIPEVYKVVFVVDRNDLDTQTIKEFNKFSEDCVDQTDSTIQLVKQFSNPDSKLIVTTIQKLNNAVNNQRHLLHMDQHRGKKIVFIFDECHRSQFGETHKRITEYFTNYQLFGFTGTPIFADNASGNSLGRRTTRDLFGECLHQYVITDAINDENVLKFSVEYVGRYRYKHSANEADIEVEAIDKQELMDSPQRLEKIVDYILANHERKTHAREFTALFAISSVDALTKYYELFKAKQAGKDNPLKIATIFSYAANEIDKDADGLLDEDVQLGLSSPGNQPTRDKLESYIADYNALFRTSYTTKDSQSFYNYYRNIGERVRNRQVDLLLVVNMFLTGFDSPSLNTLYVDKNLRYHGLLQAYSRTNRILNDVKSQGNIVTFRNLRQATNDAIELFSNRDALETIFMEPYEVYLGELNAALAQLRRVAVTPAAVDSLQGEEQKLAFVTAFRDVLRLKNLVVSFADFTFDDISIGEQELEDYKSKYLDIYDSVRRDYEPEKVSILADVDFELELIRRDEINVDYIIRLLAKVVEAPNDQKDTLLKNITNTINTDIVLRSKKELIEKFIASSLPKITDARQVETTFEQFWTNEKVQAFKRMCADEGLMTDSLQHLIDAYLYTGRLPRSDDLVRAMQVQPRVLERSTVANRTLQRFMTFIHTFIEGV